MTTFFHAPPARFSALVGAMALVAGVAAGCAAERDDAAQDAGRFDTERLARDASPSVVQVLVASPHGIRRGSGFVVDRRGLILTSGPLVEGARAVLVRLSSGSSYYRSAVLARDARHGTAVVGVQASGLPALELPASGVARLGAPVVAVGSDGFARALVSGLGFEGYYSLQTSEPLPAGFAGGPVLGDGGAVLGMAVRRIGDGRVSNVVVPNAYVREVLERSMAQLSGPHVTAAPGLGSARPQRELPEQETRQYGSQSDRLQPTAARVERGASAVDLTGQWDMVNTIRQTSYTPFEGLQLGFRVRLEQNGDRVAGSGEKRLENGRPVPAAARSPIAITGTLGQDGVLRAAFTERGERKTVRGSFRWNVGSDGKALEGSFRSDAPLTAGSSTAARIQ